MSGKYKPSALYTRLRQAEAEKEGLYDKRTEHLDTDGKALFINRLILEDSPYLLQHAHNPVNWYPWGEEAFATASKENKPVFLSIGYSTCHWCHVMEVESFDNVDVARLLNAHFISIKLDREQYPDIDEIYMMGVQLISGQGGWPMSNFLLPDGKPFFAATYFPAAGFTSLLTQIAEAWHSKHAELTSSAAQVATAIDRLLSERKDVVELDPAVAETVLQAVLKREDRSFGGLGGAPKFPQEPLLLLLIDRALRNRELESLAFVERALEGMATGGIYDQVGGGFHRYSVDAQWLVPHFEKMLYTQSQLGLVYLQATRLTGNDFFRRVCAQTLDYVLRDMQLPEGGFYSATDADSEGKEGTFFVWTLMQLREVLDAGEMALVERLYDLSERGNFEGANILSLQRSLLVSARESGNPDFYAELDGILNKLYRARELRIHPLRDNKLIVAWTGAMVTTLARAGFELGRKDWLAAAEKAAELIWSKVVNHEASPLAVRRIYLDGKVSIAGQLEDYVNLVEALIALFDTCGDERYLEQAASLMAASFARFWDDENDMFFLSPPQSAGPQLTRSRSASDGATLSAVATALQCMQLLEQRAARLAEPSSAAAMTTKLDAALGALSGALNEYPLSNPSLLRVLAARQRGSIEPIQYAGQGRVKVSARVVSRDDERIEVVLALSVLAPWHITAPQSGTGAFVPLALEVDGEERHWRAQDCTFPAASGTLAQGAGEAITIYTGDITLSAVFTRTGVAADALTNTAGFLLRLQLCDEQQCLLPEELYFRV